MFVSGKVANQQFAVFKPRIDIDWMSDHLETLEHVHQKRKSPFDVQLLHEDLKNYLDLREQIIGINSSLEEVQQIINQRKKEKANIAEQIMMHKEIKKSLVSIRESMWQLEEETVINYFKLQNCDHKSRREEQVQYCLRKSLDQQQMKLSHRELCERNDLVEFSNVSHSSFYMKNSLSALEHKLCRYFTNKLLDHDLEMFSNPDFVRSVMAEGCGHDFMNPEQIFSLRPTQDFGDRDSCNAVHLVGGASLPSFVAYFARNILQNPAVLPVIMFCVGRQYSPVTRADTDFTTSTQSQCVQIFSVSNTEEDMEKQLIFINDILVKILSVFPNFTMTEETIVDCDLCNSRQYRIEMQVRSESSLSYLILVCQGVESVQVGSVGVQGKYFSDRVMMVTRDQGPVFTVSAQLDLTKLCAVLVEMSQDQHGAVDINSVNNWLQ